MRVQKTYLWYCGISWTLWLITIILTFFSGNAFDVHNEALYNFTNTLSNVMVLISWIPLHPILCMIALHHSNKNNHVSYSLFNGLSLVFTTVLAFLLFLNHIRLTGGV